MVDDYKGGKDKLLGFFVGQVMKISSGKVTQLVNNMLKESWINNLWRVAECWRRQFAKPL